MLTHTLFKFCPRCGSRGISVLEKNGMQCTKCRYVYFHNCASAVMAIIETNQGILVAKRNHGPKKGFLDLPGGFSDYHETLEQALSREIKEELGLELASVSYAGSEPNVYRYKGVTYFTIDAIFVCKPRNFSAMKLSDEISEIFVMKPSLIDLRRIAFKSARNAIRNYLAAH
jgi:NAD+ diphosphatase